MSIEIISARPTRSSISKSILANLFREIRARIHRPRRGFQDHREKIRFENEMTLIRTIGRGGPW